MSRPVEFFSTENALKRINNINYTTKSKAIHVPNTAFAKNGTTLNQSSKEL